MRADGRTITVELAITASGAGTDLLFTAYLRDITQARLAEARRHSQYAIANALSSGFNPEVVAASVLATIGLGGGWHLGTFWLASEGDKPYLHPAAIWQREGSDFPKFTSATNALRFAPNQGLPGRVFASDEPLWLADLNDTNNFPRLAAAKEDGLVTGMAFPLISDTQAVLGVMEFFSTASIEQDSDLLSLLASLGQTIGLYLQRENSHAEMTRQKKAALEANAAMDRFIAMLSHKLRTPLTPISMWADQLAGDQSVTAEVRENAEMVQRNIEHEIRLVDELLDISKIHHGKLTLSLHPCDLNAVIRRAVENFNRF